MKGINISGGEYKEWEKSQREIQGMPLCKEQGKRIEPIIITIIIIIIIIIIAVLAWI
jgi:hypothetical protein